MARIKQSPSAAATPDSAAVPPELYDGDAITWHSEPEFREWIARHTNGISTAELRHHPPDMACWARRSRGLAAWARTVKLAGPSWWSSAQFDREALALLGLSDIAGAPGLERVRRRACPTCRRLGLPVLADRVDD